jgi:hypothetical protein
LMSSRLTSSASLLSAKFSCCAMQRQHGAGACGTRESHQRKLYEPQEAITPLEGG